MVKFINNLWFKLKSLFGGTKFLCDTCKYDWGDACNRPERPNAIRCPDYRKR